LTVALAPQQRQDARAGDLQDVGDVVVADQRLG
jgi:hypothetical protein